MHRRHGRALWRRSVADRPDFEIDGLQASKGRSTRDKSLYAWTVSAASRCSAGRLSDRHRCRRAALPLRSDPPCAARRDGHPGSPPRSAWPSSWRREPHRQPCRSRRRTRNGELLRWTRASMRGRPRSVAANRSSRLRARSAASSRLRQTISRSPGNISGALISARSRSSNSDSCNGPLSAPEPGSPARAGN